VIQRVAKEIRQLVQAPPSGIRYLPQDEEVLTEIHVEIAGPEETPYSGAFFLVKLTLSDGFPQTPPKGVFLTKIFHPNIATNGEICVNTLKRDWTPALGIAHVLQVIRCLLIVPFPESSLNDEAGRLFMESYGEYARRATIWTNIHAPKVSAAKPLEKASFSSKKTPTKEQDKSSGLSSPCSTNTNTSGDGNQNEQDEPEANEQKTGHPTQEVPVKNPVARVLTLGTPTPPTKKRSSPTSTDALTAHKKKSTLKKGIKRL
jgi:ubiquitin-conjugating enzyme E2 S